MNIRSLIFTFFFISLIMIQPAFAQNGALSFGEWRVHLPFTSTRTVAVGADKVFAGSGNAMFSYSESDFSMEQYTRANGFSELGINALSYNAENDVLVVAYENANVDLLKGNRVVNVSDIERASVSGEKTVNNIHVNGNFAYLACGFGIVVLDVVNEEIKDTYIIGEEGASVAVNQVAAGNNLLMAATSEGVMMANLDNPNLSNFNIWQRDLSGLPVGGSEGVVFAFGQFYANVNNRLYAYNGSDWSLEYEDEFWTIQSMDVTNGQIVMAQWLEVNPGTVTDARVVTIGEGMSVQNFNIGGLLRPTQAVTDERGIVWAADSWQGLYRIEPGGTAEFILPEGPRTSKVFDMVIDGERMYVAPGSVNSAWNYLYNRDGFFTYENGSWLNKNQFNTPGLVDIRDIIYIKSHPTDDRLYLASYGLGLIEIDGENYNNFTFENSSLQETIGDPNLTRVSGIAFDANNHLWVSNFGAPAPLSVYTPDGQWRSFTPDVNIGDERGLFEMLIDDLGQKWAIVKRNGILVFNHGFDLMDDADDQYFHMKSGAGNGNLQVNEVNCFAKDRDGAIWVGTNEGVAVFYCPTAVFQGGCEAVQPFVEVGGFGAFLLETEVVRAIAVDGANRKWFGTENGVWLMSPDGTEQIAYFNTENSPLLSNVINDIEVDNNTGEVFIGTERGIISYKSTATGGDVEHGEVLVYPNPVRPDYVGLIAIKGLALDASVKITDISGTLVYETTALGGQAIWDGKDYNGRKAATGVYLIFSANEDGSDTNVAKVMIVN